MWSVLLMLLAFLFLTAAMMVWVRAKTYTEAVDDVFSAAEELDRLSIKEDLTCNHCGRDDFKNRRGRLMHESRWCQEKQS